MRHMAVVMSQLEHIQQLLQWKDNGRIR